MLVKVYKVETLFANEKRVFYNDCIYKMNCVTDFHALYLPPGQTIDI